MDSQLIIPADMSTSARTYATSFFSYGRVTLSSNGISYAASGLLMKLFFKINLGNKFISKYYNGKPISYTDIIDVKPFRKNGIELVTSEINGSYYLTIPTDKSEDVQTVMDFINFCRFNGFENIRDDQSACSNLQKFIVRAQHKSGISSIITMVLAAVTGLFVPLIGVVIGYISYLLSIQSKKTYLIAISLLLTIFIFCMGCSTGLI